MILTVGLLAFTAQKYLVLTSNADKVHAFFICLNRRDEV